MQQLLKHVATVVCVIDLINECQIRSLGDAHTDTVSNKIRAVAGKLRDAIVNFDRYVMCGQLHSFDTEGIGHGQVARLRAIVLVR